MKRQQVIERHQIWVFFSLSLFAWVIWVPQAAYRYGFLAWAPSLQSPLNVLTVWSPGLAAILLTGLTLGKSQVGALFRPLLAWRVPLKWYIFALLFEPARWIMAYGFDRALGKSYELGTAPLLKAFGAAAAFMIPVAILFTWLYNKTGQSLLLVCLFHASMAVKGYLLPRLPTLTESAILWLSAIWVVAYSGLSVGHPKADVSEREASPNK